MPCENCTCGANGDPPDLFLGKPSDPESEIDFSDPQSLEQATVQIQQAKERIQKLEAELNNKKSKQAPGTIRFRSRDWFDDPDHPDSTALHIERYLNWGLSLPEITDPTKPIIGIAQSGSDLSPCNRHHLELAKRVRDGIIAAGGTPLEFPCHPIQETGKRPNAALDRNLSYLSLVEALFGYPIDGVVLLTGCDKTTPAMLMAACTVNIPTIAMNVGPMLNGYYYERLTGSGTIVWESRKRYAAGEISYDEFLDIVSSSAPSVGHCNTMGTASTMNALAEALGMGFGSAIPAAYRERGQCAYQTGLRIVDLTKKDIKPSDILTKEAFENAIAANSAIGGSTNAPIHLNAIAKHIGVQLDNDDWERVGYQLPLLVNIQPAGEFLCEEYFRAGGLPAVMAELLDNGKLPHPDAMTVTGKTWREICKGKNSWDRRVIKSFDNPMKKNSGFLHLKGSLFDSAIMKTSVISEEFQERYLSNPEDPNAFQGPCFVFDGPEDYHATIETKEVTPDAILVIRGVGPTGYPGAAEVVNMAPPTKLFKQGISELPCIGDGRQSGTAGSPSILNASPEAATGGNLAILKDGDIIRVDLNKRSCDILISEEEISKRCNAMSPYKCPASQTPWQEIYRTYVSELSEGMVLKNAVKYQRVAQVSQPLLRHSH
ncbi:hypothetical protein DASC09_054400 [Saccharomycopsis crataegensis]|uniref:Dihydroxy-acid dehydratase n=1 Tax=Saccharomycopsis crataegensis TaxID=43959 RepID=A0AAV5QU43_9ASCO|nr:hypothetical protein DASC09_054400 [Saccharomycopsis crataegensis]